jgi:phosphatidate cytidylyltransferase
MPWLRILSGVVVGILGVGVGLLGGWYFTAALCALVYLAQSEYFQMVQATGSKPAAKTTMIVSQALIISAYANMALTEAILAVAGTFTCFYLLFRPRLASISDISSSILGLFYCGFLPSYWVRLRGIPGGDASNLFLGGYWPSPFPGWRELPVGLNCVLLAIGCVCAADIAAYIFGKQIGRTRLSEISPKKTVEGALGGFGASGLTGALSSLVLQWPYAPISGGVLGLLIGVISLLGDLTESIMKRDAGVKDSGTIIPGHGGILDRMDGYIFTAPLVYYFVTLVLPMLGA